MPELRAPTPELVHPDFLDHYEVEEPPEKREWREGNFRASPGINYNTAHAHVRWSWGNPREFDCVDCDQAAAHWSLENLADAVFDERVRLWWSVDPADYLPRCQKCHGSHDARVRRERR